VRYGTRQWGAAQSDHMDGLEALFALISRHPAIGTPRPELAPGLRSMPTGSHLVFYRADGEAVTILRVLHLRMDPARHLDPRGAA